MRLPSTLAWLVDTAGAIAPPDDFLAMLGARLIADGMPLVGGSLTLAPPHPIIARRTWLWRAQNGQVIESLGFGVGLPGAADAGKPGSDWLRGIGAEAVNEHVAGTAESGRLSETPLLSWGLSRSLTAAEAELLSETARFAVAPLAALGTRLTLTDLLQSYLGQRSASQVLAGRSRRGAGETIRAVLVYGDLRGFTALSESLAPEAVIAALDGWFDRVAGAVHAFGGEVLKFIGDGVLAIFPITDQPPSVACEAALSAVAAARAGMDHLDEARSREGSPPLPFGLALHLGDVFWGNIGTADRLDFTAIGPAVNLVSRLEGLCKPLDRSVLISGAVASETKAPLVPLGEHMLRGIAEPCAVFTLPED
ncbi:adenylate/guanylate cyclase domain-containing protein [Mesorhizobium sp. BAC0120]|uniref:adenylate/guanylate cyclase domain-containing protein n=1 Tax=Mesorhizobium sp. BAC0120 TaxID=3090670 RepID=UPI00298BDA14|nr:adenylate/guanylate cyclase domain-containing protein [Mesorhizobium sp. BAC0120]MDW6021169.1 adenylate/guanylate cyclase domain-containing protein [Mesorhizobium sp. BAC0120]